MNNTDNSTEVVEEYAHDCAIVREHDDLGEELYHYEGPLGRVQSFHSLSKRVS